MRTYGTVVCAHIASYVPATITMYIGRNTHINGNLTLLCTKGKTIQNKKRDFAKHKTTDYTRN